MSEFRSLGEARTGRITANSFEHREVRYSAVRGLAMFEGDIILGTLAEIEAVSNLPQVRRLAPEGVAITGSQYRWPGGLVPYRIDPGLPRPERVEDAIRHWEARTSIRFLRLDGSTLNQHRDRVLFTPGTDCSSPVGRRGEEQQVFLEADCEAGHVMHEIGHTIGLWHEHSRENRDHYVDILWQNIAAGALIYFEQKVTDGDDIGPYDYRSIMHYPETAFSANGQPTIRAKDGSAIGQRSGLSPGDVEAVRQLYPAAGA